MPRRVRSLALLSLPLHEKAWNVRVFAGSHATLRGPEVFAEITRLPMVRPAVF
jgi:hypothetical protein